MMKKLVRHGNTYAIPIDKKTLTEAKLNANSKFDVFVLPGGGLQIQSVEEINRKQMEEEFESIAKKHHHLFKNLSKR